MPILPWGRGVSAAGVGAAERSCREEAAVAVTPAVAVWEEVAAIGRGTAVNGGEHPPGGSGRRICW